MPKKLPTVATHRYHSGVKELGQGLFVGVVTREPREGGPALERRSKSYLTRRKAKAWAEDERTSWIQSDQFNASR